jgi:hypothetical protein
LPALNQVETTMRNRLFAHLLKGFLETTHHLGTFKGHRTQQAQEGVLSIHTTLYACDVVENTT